MDLEYAGKLEQGLHIDRRRDSADQNERDFGMRLGWSAHEVDTTLRLVALAGTYGTRQNIRHPSGTLRV